METEAPCPAASSSPLRLLGFSRMSFFIFGFFLEIEMWGKKTPLSIRWKIASFCGTRWAKKNTSPLYLLTKIVPFCDNGGQKKTPKPPICWTNKWSRCISTGEILWCLISLNQILRKRNASLDDQFFTPYKKPTISTRDPFFIAKTLVAVSFISPPEELQARPYNHLSQYRGDSPTPSLVFLVVPLLQVVSFRG